MSGDNEEWFGMHTVMNRNRTRRLIDRNSREKRKPVRGAGRKRPARDITDIVKAVERSPKMLNQ